MERIIENMIIYFHIDERDWETKKEIETPVGQTLYWDYFFYVKSHLIEKWDKPTFILYGL